MTTRITQVDTTRARRHGDKTKQSSSLTLTHLLVRLSQSRDYHLLLLQHKLHYYARLRYTGRNNGYKEIQHSSARHGIGRRTEWRGGGAVWDDEFSRGGGDARLPDEESPAELPAAAHVVEDLLLAPALPGRHEHLPLARRGGSAVVLRQRSCGAER